MSAGNQHPILNASHESHRGSSWRGGALIRWIRWLGLLSVCVSLNLVSSNACDLVNLSQSFRDILRCKSAPGHSLRQLEHVQNEKVKRLYGCSKLRRGISDFFPVLYPRMKGQLSKVPLFLASLANPESNDRRNGAKEAADYNSENRVTHFLIGVGIGALAGNIAVVLFIIWYERR